MTPDIRTPATSDDTPFGESSFGNALPWTRIKAVDYAAVGDITTQLPRLLAWHENRVQRTPDYQGLLEDIAKAQDQRRNNVISLNEAVRRKERAASEKRLAALLGGAETGAAPGTENALVDDGLQFNERKLANDLAARKAREAVNDAILNEAVSIVSDSVALKQGKAQITASASPARPVMVKDLSKGSTEP